MYDHDPDGLEAVLEQMMKILPQGLNVTLGLKRLDGALIAHAAVHSEDPTGRIVIEDVGTSAMEAVLKLRARLGTGTLDRP